jgi:hypothetical protein
MQSLPHYQPFFHDSIAEILGDFVQPTPFSVGLW